MYICCNLDTFLFYNQLLVQCKVNCTTCHQIIHDFRQ